MNDLGHYRKSYEKSELLESAIPENPMVLFEQWFKEVESSEIKYEVNAMTVATIGLDGFPKARVVLLKQYDENGFVFFTNYHSEKGRAIAENPNVCLSFFWHSLDRQVIIKGVATKTSENVSDQYFNSRPEGSKLGAVVSNQSEVVESREALEQRLLELEKEYSEKSIPRPEHWGGYRVQPVEIEFWQGRPNRLHDRIRFEMQDNFTWNTVRLAP